MSSSDPIMRSCRQNLSVATAFWGACLVLVVAEVAVGSNLVIGGLFFLSIPLLVAVLTWVNKGIVFDRAPRTLASVVVLGLSVLVVSSLIILVGLLAAANLKSLMIGA
ncbi:MAG: hypothetical protein GTO67_05995 [Gammaproteobacteria bacterium]|nr:hypothetical protein [Gammaproteobacteria bacterium]NIM72785.1 hypothetical protein [Gammaproteobacteria bacterium]NIN38242.1 hypothetical protein [Gammaproteobacteria bacterium]NIO24533.1 hypothetical protein [Gammaproteobacteria bacterium]NIO65142.1 hypothetical protein [Gammaproteobacteria bacterium]